MIRFIPEVIGLACDTVKAVVEPIKDAVEEVDDLVTEHIRELRND